MNPDRVRRLDRALGAPICALLTSWRRVRALFGGERGAQIPPRKLLFVKLIEQGATVLAYPAIREAVEKLGRENVYFWVFAENRPILDLLDVLPPENVLVLRTDGSLRFLVGILQSLRRIRRAGVDATVDMEFYARASAILAYLTGARRRSGLHRFTSEAPYRGDLLTHRVPYNPHLHTAAMFQILTQAVFADSPRDGVCKLGLARGGLRPPAFQPSASLQKDARSILARVTEGRIGRPLILLNPNASDLMPLRRWPTDRFVDLAGRILDAYPDSNVLITGAPSEREAARAVANEISHPRAFNLAGETTLEQLLALYCMADVLVTNDSGPGHFAAMTPIHSIVLFGPETPLLYGPLGPNTHVLSADLACSPCVSVLNHRFSPCRDNVCMKSITVDHVFDLLASLLPPAQRASDRQAAASIASPAVP